MPDLHAILPSRGDVQARYSVRLLADVRPAPEGLVHRTVAGEERVAWADVHYALAAEIGEPQGIRIVVFDLVMGDADEPWQILRFGAEPGEDAEAAAQVLAEVLPPQRLGAAVKSLASETVVGEWYPDLPTFEEAAVSLLAARASRDRRPCTEPC